MNHKTRPVQVWQDIDVGIADMVEHLNTIPGVRTDASCQGTIGEGGSAPYGPYVMANWTPEGLTALKEKYDIKPEGNGSWGYVYPRCRSTDNDCSECACGTEDKYDIWTPQEVYDLREENKRLREKLREVTRAFKQKAKHVDNLLKLKRNAYSSAEVKK